MTLQLAPGLAIRGIPFESFAGLSGRSKVLARFLEEQL
jgi:hypothetical protein